MAFWLLKHKQIRNVDKISLKVHRYFKRIKNRKCWPNALGDLMNEWMRWKIEFEMFCSPQITDEILQSYFVIFMVGFLSPLSVRVLVNFFYWTTLMLISAQNFYKNLFIGVFWKCYSLIWDEIGDIVLICASLIPSRICTFFCTSWKLDLPWAALVLSFCAILIMWMVFICASGGRGRDVQNQRTPNLSQLPSAVCLGRHAEAWTVRVCLELCPQIWNPWSWWFRWNYGFMNTSSSFASMH